MKGVSLLQIKEHRDAIEALEEAVRLRPYRREAYYHLAEYYGLQGGEDNVYKGIGYISSCTAQIDRREPLQNDDIYNSLGYLLHARFLQKIKAHKPALTVLEK